MTNEPPILIAKILLTVRSDGTLEVTGNVDNYEYALAMLDGAKEALRTHCGHAAHKATVIVPADYTAFQKLV